MTTPSTDTAVRESVVVEVPIERAFSVFTQDMASWWPADHHMIESVAAMVLEPRQGGRVYDEAADGSVCQWGRVLAWEPPQRLVFSWDISTQWQVETDPTRTSEVEVRFTAESPSRTRVELEHRHIERHGEGWQGMREVVGSPGGWRRTLDSFAAAVR